MSDEKLKNVPDLQGMTFAEYFQYTRATPEQREFMKSRKEEEQKRRSLPSDHPFNNPFYVSPFGDD